MGAGDEEQARTHGRLVRLGGVVVLLTCGPVPPLLEHPHDGSGVPAGAAQRTSSPSIASHHRATVVRPTARSPASAAAAASAAVSTQAWPPGRTVAAMATASTGVSPRPRHATTNGAGRGSAGAQRIVAPSPGSTSGMGSHAVEPQAKHRGRRDRAEPWHATGRPSRKQEGPRPPRCHAPQVAAGRTDELVQASDHGRTLRGAHPKVARVGPGRRSVDRLRTKHQPVSSQSRMFRSNACGPISSALAQTARRPWALEGPCRLPWPTSRALGPR